MTWEEWTRQTNGSPQRGSPRVRVSQSSAIRIPRCSPHDIHLLCENMNGVRRFLGGAVTVSNSPPTTPSDIPTGKPSWQSSPIQTRADSPEGPSATAQSQILRKDKQWSIHAGEDDSIAMPQQRVANGTSVAPSRSYPSVSSLSSHPFRSSSPLSGISSSRISSPGLQPTRASINSQDLGDRRTLRLLNVRDELLISLLASEAVVDSRGYEMLSAEDVDELKKAGLLLNLACRMSLTRVYRSCKSSTQDSRP